MKLAAKFTTLLIVGIGIMIFVDGWLVANRDIQMFDEDARRDAQRFGDQLGPMVADHWKQGGHEEVESFLKQLNAPGDSIQQPGLTEVTRIRWVMLDATATEPRKPMATQDELAPVISGEKSSIQHVEQGQIYMLTYKRVVTGGPPAALEVVEPLTHSGDIKRMFVTRMLILTGITMLFGVATVMLLGRELVGRPLRVLLDKTRRIGTGDLSGPAHLKRHDEFGELATAINSMCDQLSSARETVELETAAKVQAVNQLRHADRLRTIGRLAAGIAHEIGTPLNVIGGRAEMLVSGSMSPEETAKSANVIKSESQRITLIVRNLLDFARRSTPHRRKTDVVELVRQTVEALRPLAEGRQINIRIDGDSAPQVCQVDSAQFKQILTNLMVNGAQAMPDGGDLEIGLATEFLTTTPTEQAAAGPYVRVSVRDTGQGIAAEDLPNIFEPFFTTKETGEGTGLGLSIALGIAQEHGGWIDVDSEVGQGSCFTVYLPLEKNE